MSVANDVLYDLGDEVLTATVQAFSDAGVAVPDRRYVGAGEPVDDCDQLVVWLGRLFNGQPGQEVAVDTAFHVGRSLEVNIRIIRCVPAVTDSGGVPNADDIDAASRQIAVDMWVTVQGLIALGNDREFLADCQRWAFIEVVPFEWQGGVGGFDAVLHVQVV